MLGESFPLTQRAKVLFKTDFSHIVTKIASVIEAPWVKGECQVVAPQKLPIDPAVINAFHARGIELPEEQYAKWVAGKNPQLSIPQGREIQDFRLEVDISDNVYDLYTQQGYQFATFKHHHPSAPSHAPINAAAIRPMGPKYIVCGDDKLCYWRSKGLSAAKRRKRQNF